MMPIASSLASGDDDLGEDAGNSTRGLGIEHSIERHDAAEGRYRVAGERLAVSLGEARALGDSAWIGVLDDDAGGRAPRIELADALVGRVGIVDVVVGKLLALQLSCATPERRSPVR